MLCRSRALLAAEFKQKSRAGRVWPRAGYGLMFLPYTYARQLPMRGVIWVTRDSNRLTNFADRYRTVLDDLDVKRNEEELHVPLSDVRWCDYRRLYWRCSFCGYVYRKLVSVRIKYHAGCNRCKGRHASEVLGAQCGSAPLREYSPDLAAQLAGPAEVCANMAGLSCTSKLNASWTCRACGREYSETIRSRTGRVEDGQCPLHPHVTRWTAYCPSCRWQAALSPVGAQARTQGYYLGLDDTPDGDGGRGGSRGDTTCAHGGVATRPLPRRKRLVS